MITFRFEGIDEAEFRVLTATLRDERKQKMEAEKAEEAVKEKIIEKLRETRGLEIATVPIGEIIHVEGLVMIEVCAMNKFDSKGFRLSEPKMFEAWTKDFRMVKFKPIL